ncbi:hypothetical protein [Gorillibacterium sp. sgz5001074]|uniref:hypothetical protein n=1 Tax=Gorillibacterium sp. sgz5001074 TaxID=3446695 RepID=UPI003F66CFB9
MTKDMCRMAVTTYAEECLKRGHTALPETFLLVWPEFEHEEFYDTIEAEIERVKGLHVKEAKAG